MMDELNNQPTAPNADGAGAPADAGNDGSQQPQEPAEGGQPMPAGNPEDGSQNA